jgi:transposase
MTVPGVGAVTAAAFMATVDDPERFRRSSSVGAYFGLTPRRCQSGDIDYTGERRRFASTLMSSHVDWECGRVKAVSREAGARKCEP